MDSASRVEASDDLLLRIFSHFRLLDRLRLTVACRRWQRLLLSHLRFSRVDAWHARSLLESSAARGTPVRHIDISALQSLDIPTYSNFFLGLLEYLRDGSAGQALQGLATWDPAVGVGSFCDVMSLGFSSVQLLAAWCPNLGPSTALAVVASTSKDAVEMLSLLPDGRHTLELALDGTAGTRTAEEQNEDFRAILRSPKLTGLYVVSTVPSKPRSESGGVLMAAFSAMMHELSVSLAADDIDSSPCRITHLNLGCGPGDAGGDPAFETAEQVVEAFSAPHPCPGTPWRLENLSFFGCIPAVVVASALRRSHGALRRLQLGPYVRCLDVMSPEALSALLRCSCGSSVEELSIALRPATTPAQRLTAADAAILQGIASLVELPGCHVRSLEITGGAFDSVSSSRPGPTRAFGDLCQALLRNLSLGRLALVAREVLADDLPPATLGVREAALLNRALAGRPAHAAPLRSLVVPVGRLQVPDSYAAGSVPVLFAAARVPAVRLELGEQTPAWAVTGLCAYNPHVRSLEIEVGDAARTAYGAAAVAAAAELAEAEAAEFEWDEGGPPGLEDYRGPPFPAAVSGPEECADIFDSLQERVRGGAPVAAQLLKLALPWDFPWALDPRWEDPGLWRANNEPTEDEYGSSKIGEFNDHLKEFEMKVSVACWSISSFLSAARQLVVLDLGSFQFGRSAESWRVARAAALSPTLQFLCFGGLRGIMDHCSFLSEFKASNNLRCLVFAHGCIANDYAGAIGKAAADVSCTPGGDDKQRRRRLLRDVAFTEDYECEFPREQNGVSLGRFRGRGTRGKHELTWRGIEQLARAALEDSPRLQLHVSGMTLHASGSSSSVAATAPVGDEAEKKEEQGSRQGGPSSDESEQPSFLGYAETEWGVAVLAALSPGVRRRVRIVKKPLRLADLFDENAVVAGGGGV